MSASSPRTPATVRRADYAPPPYRLPSIALRFELFEAHAVVRADLRLERDAHTAAGAPLVLDGHGLELVALELDGAPLASERYRVDDAHLTLLAPPPGPFTLGVVTRLRPRENKALEGLYESRGNLFTQCEPEGFRRITYSLDRPDVMARYRTTVVADRARCPVLLSNGNPVARGELDDGRHWITWEDPFPKPSYLFALVAGRLAERTGHFTTRSGRRVELRFYVETQHLDQVDHALRSLERAMAWDEARFGLEYDLDLYMVVAVSDFNMGAMENKGLNVFNTKYVLAKPETATDADFEGILGVIGHEYFHNWTGNRVTCRDWFQLSLKEGLTVFRDQEFSSDLGSRGVKRIQDVRALRSAQFPEDAGPMAHPVRPDAYVEINNFYTATVYNKGAEVVRMLHTLLGEAGFRRGIDLYFARHDGQAVTCDDFLAAMADANGVDLTQFGRWYAQAGTPRLLARGAYDAAARRYTLTLAQSCPPTPGQPQKQPLHVPVAVGLLDPEGRPIPLRLSGEKPAAGPGPAPTTRVLELRRAEETFSFEDVPAPPVPSLLRGFSAPVRLVVEGEDERMLLHRLAFDGDDFNRWDAAQSLAARLILALVEARRGGRPLEPPEAFCDALGRALRSPADPALLAQVLALPSETWLAELTEEVDVDGLHAARRFVLRALAVRLRPVLEERYEALAEAAGAPYVLDAASMGRRALKNACLALLLELDEPAWTARCLAQLEVASNMNDRLGALVPLSHGEAPERAQALAAFYERWRGEDLVVDKWLAIQASSRRSDTVEVVRRLLRHEAFRLENPNRVRALLGTFAHGNPARFHAADGGGYALVAEQVLALDALNPQGAARLAGAFTRWRRYDAARRDAMRAHLERMAGRPALSPDLYEIVTKSLEAAP